MTFYIVLLIIGVIFLISNLGYNVWKFWPVILIALGTWGIFTKPRKKKSHFHLFKELSNFNEEKLEGKYLYVEVTKKTGEQVSKLKVPCKLIKYGLSFSGPILHISDTDISVEDLKKVFETSEEILTITTENKTVKIWVA